MSYEAKTDWKYDDIVTERDLNRIEQGVQDAQEKADQASARAGQAENNSKAYTDQQIQLVTETGIPKLVTYPFVLMAEDEGQTDFLIPLETFDKETDTVLVVQNSTVLSTERFSVMDEKTVRLAEGVQIGTKIFIQVFKNVPLGPEGAINGGVIAVNSLPSDRVQGFDELFTSVSDGKSKLETAITDKNGIVSKQENIATFDELDAGIRSIPQAKGNAERTDVLAGRTFSSESAGIEQEGTMVNRGAVSNTITTQNGQFIIPQGYHNGNGKITASFLNLAPTNIKRGVNIGGVVGTLVEGLGTQRLFDMSYTNTTDSAENIGETTQIKYSPNLFTFSSKFKAAIFTPLSSYIFRSHVNKHGGTTYESARVYMTIGNTEKHLWNAYARLLTTILFMLLCYYMMK